MERRTFLGVIAGGLLAAPHVVGAQQAGWVPRIGYLSGGSLSRVAQRTAFSEGLRALGWIEGQNIFVEERWAEGQYEKLPGLAAELVNQKVDVILAAGSTAEILRRETSHLNDSDCDDDRGRSRRTGLHLKRPAAWREHHWDGLGPRPGHHGEVF